MFDVFGRRPKKTNKSEQVEAPLTEQKPAPRLPKEPAFHLSTRNFQEFEDNDVAIKLWLPELAERRLIELSDHRGQSRSKLLRLVFFRYLYGEYELEAMRARQEGLFLPPPRIMAAVSRHRSGPNTTPELGKNLEDTKLWLPARMRTDLQSQADRSEKPLSQFMREVLVSILFGHLPLADALKPDAEEPEKK